MKTENEMNRMRMLQAVYYIGWKVLYGMIGTRMDKCHLALVMN